MGDTKEKFAPLVIGGFAYLITSQLVFPYYDDFWKPKLVSAFSNRFPGDIYDPDRDDTMNVQILGAVLAYLLFGCGLVSFLDFIVPSSMTLGWKVQGLKSYFTLPQWMDAVGLSLVNMFVFSWAVMLPVWHVQFNGVLRGGTPVASMSDEFDIKIAAFHLILHFFIIDFWFYSTHWIIHQGPLYKWIHKKHHRFKAPNAVACMYANPIEFCIGNVGGVILAPALTNCHPYLGAFWYAFALTSTCGSHSGYTFLGASSHDAHHEHLDCNYGTQVFMDKLFGTEFVGSELERKVIDFRRKNAEKEMKDNIKDK